MALRPGELWGLQWRDLDGRTIQIRRNVKELQGKLIIEAPKTRAGERTLPLPDQIRTEMEALKAVDSKPTDHIFATENGGPIRHGNFRHKIWNPTLKLAGVTHKHPYTLRHTAATRMINSGQLSLTAVSKWLGHLDITTTLRNYAHLMTNELEEVAEFLAK